MTKAQILTKSGTKIIIEGETREVATLIQQIQGEPNLARHLGFKAKKGSHKISKQKATLISLIDSLIDGGFFRKPKNLAAIKIALAEMGHVYPVTTLSPTLLRLVRRRQLRRIRDKNRWLYTS